MKKEEAHKEVSRLLSHYSSLQFEKDVTHVRNEDVIVKEMKMFSERIHAVIDECISYECMNMARKIANELEENQCKIDDICNPEAQEIRDRMISNLQQKVDEIN